MRKRSSNEGEKEDTRRPTENKKTPKVPITLAPNIGMMTLETGHMPTVKPKLREDTHPA